MGGDLGGGNIATRSTWMADEVSLRCWSGTQEHEDIAFNQQYLGDENLRLGHRPLPA